MKKAIFSFAFASFLCIGGCAPPAPSNVNVNVSTEPTTDVSNPVSTESAPVLSSNTTANGNTTASAETPNGNVTAGAEVPAGETP